MIYTLEQFSDRLPNDETRIALMNDLVKIGSARLLPRISFNKLAFESMVVPDCRIAKMLKPYVESMADPISEDEILEVAAGITSEMFYAAPYRYSLDPKFLNAQKLKQADATAIVYDIYSTMICDIFRERFNSFRKNDIKKSNTKDFFENLNAFLKTL